MDIVKDSVFNYKYDFESDVIDVKNYFDEYAKSLYPVDTCQEDKCRNPSDENGCGAKDCKNDEFYRNFLGITVEELKELKERTSVEHLTCEGEIQPITHEFYKKFNENDLRERVVTENNQEEEIEIKEESENNMEIESDLISVRSRSEMSDVTKNDFCRSYFKYCNYQWCVPGDKQVKNKSALDVFNFSTIVACVKIYYPFFSHKTKNLKIKLLQEIHILGDQTLAELKDKIICSMDYVGDKDLSNECFLKDVGLNVTAKDEYPSSFIFIENVFYNDTRSPELTDLSRVIREWGPKRNLGPFEAKSMEKTKISELNLRIGRPYVYQHQGNCEHVIMFSDIRFLETSDSNKLTCYPRIHCTGRLYGKHCMMCSDSYAKWFVVGNERLTHDRAYLCNKCFFSYNYINGLKVGEFEAFRYVDPVALL